MNREKIIQDTIAYVKNEIEGKCVGHDFFHIERVWNMSKYIAEKEGADRFIVELAALLHDLGDYKLNQGVDLGSKPARIYLESINIDSDIINKVAHIIDNMSYSHRYEAQELTLEGKVVQDADRVDSLGAIGIARCLSFNGARDNQIYNPDIKPNPNKSKDEYRAAKATAINHFYEKLLLIKDMMNTKSGKEIAEGRHKFMEEYLSHFYKEWEGIE